MFVVVLCSVLSVAVVAVVQGQNVSPVIIPTARGGPPLVIGHRGAAGHRPEHTIASYELAIDYGVDFIEPDLVLTKDGVLIARHENDITGTSDVAQKFPERRTTKTIDGKAIVGYFSEDFTLAEIKTLRAKERLFFRNQGWNGVYEIATFQEVIDLAKRKSQEQGRVIGIYPETKHPSYFRSIGLALEPPLIRALVGNGYTDANAPVFVQSFEVQNLKELSKLTNVRLVQLMEDSKLRPYDYIAAGDQRTYGDLMTPTALVAVATYAQGIGPSKRSIVPQGSDMALLKPTSLVADAHKVGLVVHPYTFRDEPEFLAPDYRLDPVKGVSAVLHARCRWCVLGFRRHRSPRAESAAALARNFHALKATIDPANSADQGNEKCRFITATRRPPPQEAETSRMVRFGLMLEPTIGLASQQRRMPVTDKEHDRDLGRRVSLEDCHDGPHHNHRPFRFRIPHCDTHLSTVQQCAGGANDSRLRWSGLRPACLDLRRVRPRLSNIDQVRYAAGRMKLARG